MADLNWKIAGRAGEGIAATTFLMGKIGQRAGLSVFEYSEYPSLIRGGHTSGQVRLSTIPISSQRRSVDLMVVLNEESISNHLEEFLPTTRFLIDTQDDKIDFSKYPTIQASQLVTVPMVSISREVTGKSLASNMVALAVSAYLLGLDQTVLHEVIRHFFAKKGDDVVAENIRAAEAGHAYAIEHCAPGTPINNNPTETNKASASLLMTGTEAIGFGALSAGVQYYSAYPMTPSSALMTFMADASTSWPLIVKHAEDEIAAINNALGASFAGTRAMTGTAGGGFALMVEAVSLAGVTELPLVCVVGGRPGPATGLPTWTSQTDLSFVMAAGHGEFPKVVLTPGNLEECFHLTRLAFEIAEQYHTQVYIIADKYLLESRMSIPKDLIPTEWTNTRTSLVSDPLPEDNSYRRYLDSPEGYSPRTIPGQPHGLHLVNSYEHDDYGYATEDAAIAAAMVEKRLRKLDGIRTLLPDPILLGKKNAERTLICWGSTRLVVEDVLHFFETHPEEPSVNAIHLSFMLPFKSESFLALVSEAKHLILIEGNRQGQAEHHIRAETGITVNDRIQRFDGRPFYAQDIIAKLINS